MRITTNNRAKLIKTIFFGSLLFDKKSKPLPIHSMISMSICFINAAQKY